MKISDLEVTEYDSDVIFLVDAPPKRYRYVPKKDITAYELARLMPLLQYPEAIEHSESDLLRHFEEVK